MSNYVGSYVHADGRAPPDSETFAHTVMLIFVHHIYTRAVLGGLNILHCPPLNLSYKNPMNFVYAI